MAKPDEINLIFQLMIVCTYLVQYGNTLTKGGIFSQSSVFQAFSDVMVIIDGVSTFCRGQFANLGPHLDISLLTHPIEK